MNKPEYVKIDDELYKINTDFRVAIECNNIARDENIGDYERALAIIYKLFGEKGLDCKSQNELIEKGLKYLSLGKEQNGVKSQPQDKYELDFNKCIGLIKSSFKFDYKYDPYELDYLHWYDFYNDLENLSSSDLGNCCIYNRINNILHQDETKIKDNKERNKLKEIKEELRKEYCIELKKEITKQQEESAKAFYKSLGINL